MAPGLCSVSFEDEILLDLSDEALEGFRFIHGQIRHHFTVEGDAFDLKLVDELRIGHSLFPYGCIDPHDPQTAVVALLEFAADIAVCESFLEDVFRNGIYILAFAVESLGLFEYPLPSGP